MFAQDVQRFKQHRAIFLGRARWLISRQPSGEHRPRRRRHRQFALDLGDRAELAAHLLDRVPTQALIECPDEVPHVDAHARHDDTVGMSLAELGKPGLEVEVTLAAQLDAVETALERELPLVLQRLAEQQLLLAGDPPVSHERASGASTRPERSRRTPAGYTVMTPSPAPAASSTPAEVPVVARPETAARPARLRPVAGRAVRTRLATVATSKT